MLRCDMNPEKDTQIGRLEDIQLHRTASKLRQCGLRLLGFCNQRMCPSCAINKARKEIKRVQSKLKRLNDPQECILVLRSSGVDDLYPFTVWRPEPSRNAPSFWS
jgi:hypothetical protein